MKQHYFDLLMPNHTVRYFDVGEHCSDPQPGDWLLVDHGTQVSYGIKLGQRLIANTTQRELRGYTWADHSAVFTELAGGRINISEMGFSGHALRPLMHYHEKRYAIVHFDISDDVRESVLRQDRAMWKADYGYLQYAGLLLNGLTATNLDLSHGDAIICSTHVTLSGMPMGFMPDRLPQSIMPAHLCMYAGAKFPLPQ